jgi:fumarate reductase subunit D
MGLFSLLFLEIIVIRAGLLIPSGVLGGQTIWEESLSSAYRRSIGRVHGFV